MIEFCDLGDWTEELRLAVAAGQVDDGIVRRSPLWASDTMWVTVYFTAAYSFGLVPVVCRELVDRFASPDDVAKEKARKRIERMLADTDAEIQALGLEARGGHWVMPGRM